MKSKKWHRFFLLSAVTAGLLVSQSIIALSSGDVETAVDPHLEQIEGMELGSVMNPIPVDSCGRLLGGKSYYLTKDLYCHLTRPTAVGIYVGEDAFLDLRSSSVRGINGMGVGIYLADGATLFHAYRPSFQSTVSGFDIGVVVSGSNRVEGVIISNNKSVGVSMRDASNSEITGNWIIRNHLGIVDDHGMNNTIRRNVVVGNKTGGIQVSATGDLIAHNVSAANGGYNLQDVTADTGGSCNEWVGNISSPEDNVNPLECFE